MLGFIRKNSWNFKGFWGNFFIVGWFSQYTVACSRDICSKWLREDEQHACKSNLAVREFLESSDKINQRE